ncbi:MAG: sugar transferase [Lachnospiraceae bacterium]|nr:sugar transferase [Lachnospiraceae bacterium]
MISDCLMMVLSFLAATIFARIPFMESLHLYGPICVVFILIFMMANKDARMYNVTTFFYVDRTFSNVTKSFLISAVPTAMIVLVYIDRHEADWYFYGAYAVFAYFLLLESAFIMRFVATHSKLNAPRVLLVGDIARLEKFKSFLFKSNTSVQLIGYVSLEENHDTHYLGHVSNLEEILLKHNIGQVYLMHCKDDEIDIQPYIDICLEMGVSIRVIMSLYKAHGAQRYVSSVGTYPVITYHKVCLNQSSKFAKRVIDIFGSLVGIILFSPIMLLAAIAIKLDSKGPVLFKQQRAGLNGRPFKMYKFRSMCVDAEELKEKLREQNEVKDGMMFKIKDDPRITRVGKFIRKTSIDELPQFFNVLLGSMSLVGTRPPTMDEVAKYERSHWRRMSIKPGITGMWQVSGRSQITDFDEIVELDTEYIDKWSIWFDFWIMIKTVFSLLRRKGAY